MSDATSPPALAFTQVSYQYDGGITALAEISLTIRQGEAVALCGPNGSGKTTLLKLAAGLLAPSAGTISLDSTLLDAKNRPEAFRKVGFLFQDADDQLFCPTVADDIAYGPKNLELSKDEVAARVHAALEIMRISHLAHRPIHHLSGGEKKRAALAGLVAMQTPMLVLDEPTSGLDPASARELMTMLRMLNQEHGYCTIVATHDIDRIPEYADRVIILNGGSLFRDGRVAEVLTDIPALREVRLDAPLIAQYFYWKAHRAGITPTHIPLTLDEALTGDELVHRT
jgi:cobalt/nickel transport system ATP-binding protein